MPSRIDQRGQQRLAELLTVVLDRMNVRANVLAGDGSTNELAEIDQGTLDSKIRTEFEQYVGDYPFLKFILETVNNDLARDRPFDIRAKPAKLKEIAGYEDVGQYARGLVDRFSSLPWVYKMSIPIPDSVGVQLIQHLGPVGISTEIEFTAIDDAFREMHDPKKEQPDGPAHGALGASLLSRWSEQDVGEAAAISFNVQGFQGVNRAYEPMLESWHNLDSIIGVCLAHRMFILAQGIPTRDVNASAAMQLVSRRVGDDWKFITAQPLDKSRSRMLSMLSIHPSVNADTPTMARVRWEMLLTALAACFTNTANAKRVRLAAKWLTDSMISEDALLPFVQATVALEILLGDGKKNNDIGLGELLRNRCAYLVGETHDERQEILRNFDDIYAVRSAIVHNGKHKLNPREQALMYQLRQLVSKVIVHELGMFRVADRHTRTTGVLQRAGIRAPDLES